MLIQHVTLYNQPDYLLDIRIEQERIVAMATDLTPKEGEVVIEAHGLTAFPGFIDLHEHFRDPGFTNKETVASGSLAAAHGGFTTVCTMPNVSPVPDDVESFEAMDAHNQTGVVHIKQYAPITKGLKSQTLTPMAELAEAGAIAFTNDGVGVQDAHTMLEAMREAARLNLPIVAHAEDESLVNGGVIQEGNTQQAFGLNGINDLSEAIQVARDVMLAQATGAHYHVCHVSCRKTVEVIRNAKQAGISVTCEVCPHHLLLSDEDITANHGYFKMNPPLRHRNDVEAMIEGLCDGTIDCIVTDHAPHTKEEKQVTMDQATFGIIGSELCFPLLYTYFVKKGVFTLEQVVQWLNEKPACVMHLEQPAIAVGKAANLSLINLDDDFEVTEDFLQSKGKNTPYLHQTLYGRIMMTIVDGHIAYQEEK